MGSHAQNTTPNPVLYSAVTHPFRGYVFTQNTPNATQKHAFSWPDFESEPNVGNLDLYWAKCLKSGQNLSRSGEKNLFIEQGDQSCSWRGEEVPWRRTKGLDICCCCCQCCSGVGVPAPCCAGPLQGCLRPAVQLPAVRAAKEEREAVWKAVRIEAWEGWQGGAFTCEGGRMRAVSEWQRQCQRQRRQ